MHTPEEQKTIIELLSEQISYEQEQIEHWQEVCDDLGGFRVDGDINKPPLKYLKAHQSKLVTLRNFQKTLVKGV